MAEIPAIEWTDSTWNPVTGCTKVSRGCDNCYAERFAERFRGVAGHPFEMGFDLTLREERLVQPLRWRRPRQIFVNSMSDLFHKAVPWSYVDRVFDVAHSVKLLILNPNPPMDGARTAEVGKGVTGAMIWARIRVDGRLAGGLQALLGAPMAACSGCGERDGGIGHGKRRSRTGMARVGGDVQLTGWRVRGGRAPSGWEWNGSQPGQGAAELGFPRPMLGKMQGEAARRAGEPSR